ncbi:hinge connector of long tail fiber proximal connector [Escherichia phage AnYang]|uniref:Hinge connector of long tail fiber proximal connector n=1 Tax=Escherichia phage AnYang TaxID=2499909 RepID=A0A410T4R0_9CAUD|nr:long tail fiber protein proximal connector [Escherichia phage AnYang]QAU03690.1 hinge connector of long tail fiber proximal connector [Escherichia phage AnYang]
MERFMAEFGQDYVQIPVLSENNAVSYKLSIAGSCTKSTKKAYIKFQDEDFGPQNFQSGLNLVEIDPTNNTIVTTKSYAFTKDHDVISQAFITYISSIPAGRIVCFISSGKLNASQILIDWFRASGSAAFPDKWLIDKVDTSYSAFYVSGRNAIVMEHVLYNDGVLVEDVSTPLEVVYDNFNDVGGTGFPVRVVEDENTYYSGATQEIKRFPTESTITPCAGYNMVPGDFFYLKFQMTYDQALKDLGTTQMSIRFFNGQEMLQSTDINIPVGAGSPPAGAWMSFERVIEVPPNANGFTLYCRKTVSGGVGGVRNVMFGEIARPEDTPKSAEIGVNGIRMSYGTETRSMGNVIAQLNDKSSGNAGKVFVQEFKEKY